MSARLASALAALALLANGCASTGRSESWIGPRTWSGPALHEQPAAALGVVDDVAATSGELRTVPVRWSPLLDGDVAGYAIERAEAETGPYQRMSTQVGRFHTNWIDDDNLEDGSRRYYRVRAFDATGATGPPSEPAAATTAPAPAPPTGFEAISHLPRRVALRWEPSPDATVGGYEISRSTAAGGTFLPLAQIDGRFQTSWVDEGLGDLRVFYYRVAARNLRGGVGEASGLARAVTKAEPLPPMGLTVAEQRLGENQLRWVPNVEEDLVAYEVRRRRGDAGEEEVIARVPPDETAAADAQVSAGERVAYRLLAVDADGLVSAPSDALDVVSVDYGLRVAQAEDGRLELRWDPAVAATLAEVRVIELGVLGEHEVGRVSGDRFPLDGLAAGERRRFRLQGIRPDGSSAPESPPLDVVAPLATAAAR